MPGIIEFPKVVQDALAQYGDLFSNECQRRHFAEYLTGLFVAERKSVLGIHSEFAETTDQSCLNRFMTEAAWNVESLNQRRLDELQKLLPRLELAYKFANARAVIAIEGWDAVGKGGITRRLMAPLDPRGY